MNTTLGPALLHGAQGSNDAVLEVESLRVSTYSGDDIIEELGFRIRPGQVLGVVGESGSGKTTMAKALMAYVEQGARITGGSITIAGEPVPTKNEQAARRVRGRLISYVAQNPGTALNPSTRVGSVVAGPIRAHGHPGVSTVEAVDRALTAVGLPKDESFKSRYPHQLSGGQQQRLAIAAALVCEPPVLVLDEPTTGLDVVTQRTILTELRRLSKDRDVAMVYITHDLSVIAQIADHIAVMYAGTLVETGPAREVLRRPRHPYTRALLMSIPDHRQPAVLTPMPGVVADVGSRPVGCVLQNRCAMRIDECTIERPPPVIVNPEHRARCIRAGEVPAPGLDTQTVSGRAEQTPGETVLRVSNLMAEHRSRRGAVVAAEDISFELRKRSCLALVGESGSGKTTIARTLAGLHTQASGQIELEGKSLPFRARSRTKEQRRRVQMIMQNPANALNPRSTVAAAITHPARSLRGLSRRAAETELASWLDLVRLPSSVARRYPAELSGGEKQRVGIARALAAGPDVVICDEITSALDVSVQAAVLNLLAQLRDELSLSMLFITHDLGVVANLADEVMLLSKGVVAEHGPTSQVLASPQHTYTQELLAAAPSISLAIRQWSNGSAVSPTAGGTHEGA